MRRVILTPVEVMSPGTKVVSADSCGVSAWTKTAKITVLSPDDSRTRYFLKIGTGRSAHALTDGEYHSASAINEVIADLVPKAIGRGDYHDGESQVYFFLGAFHDMDLSTAPEPASFTSKIAELHSKGKSPSGKFGFMVPTVLGIFERTVKWETSWATCFANQLTDVIGYDNETNGPWPEYDAACRQVIDVVIPKLLGALQSDGRNIEPALIHGDLWEQNIGIDMETGETIVFDPGSTYAHNEMEFGTWRCSWAYYFNSPIYMRHYQRHIEPSEPVDEWDDRNRLYSLHPYLNDSAGHPGSVSRSTAYNDMLFLCEKYAPLDTLGRYDPENDISVTRTFVKHATHSLKDAHLSNS
ncbi:hypothetical protein EJ08DRAFT_580000 [Tothia fuscella]|uniref:protein-ribulosamine 3-kinase n=1 Tax=Tothia fuscella TaxID=1048955 RepID=A0A9P4U3H6_9PEZI|nr:hypothetical protein EJ08DRAFT_580000 [Tothia fuscella]